MNQVTSANDVRRESRVNYRRAATHCQFDKNQVVAWSNKLGNHRLLQDYETEVRLGSSLRGCRFYGEGVSFGAVNLRKLDPSGFMK